MTSKYFKKIQHDENYYSLVRDYKIAKNRRRTQPSKRLNHFTIQQCAICLGNCIEQCTPENCSHIFCVTCISEWASRSLLCPLCKKEFLTIKNSGKVLRRFERPAQELSEDEGYEIEDDPEEGIEDYTDILDRSHGYELDGFVVEDDYVEYAEEDCW